MRKGIGGDMHEQWDGFIHPSPRRRPFRRRATGVFAGLFTVLLMIPASAGPVAHRSHHPTDRGIFGRAPGPTSGATAVSASLPSGFQDTVVFSGLTHPTSVRFSPDGRVFVAEKSGLVKVFDGLSDPTPITFGDLRTNVDDYWDRGLLGLALDPNFPTVPYVYVLYTYDAPIGGTAPTWNDACPTPPGPTTDGCVVSGRLSRLQANGDVMTGTEQVLIEDWCQQFPSHSIGDLVFGPDGALYASGGEGASFNTEDYGQYGNPLNPCGDPPAGSGGTETKPTAEGGALRAQDLRTPNDPTTLDGSILRLDPSTGAGLPNNPLAGSSDPNARRIIAYGERNPFRFTIRPGTNEIWIGNVGWGRWEEINRIPGPTDSTVENFGWPCYENTAVEYGNLNMCSGWTQTRPYFSYAHGKTIAGETCLTGDSSITGLAFYAGAAYPVAYRGALFFADYSRNCIWVMYPGGNGLPNPNNIAPFDQGAAAPVDLQAGPGGDLFYVDFTGGTIHRIQYASGDSPPVARATASPTSGPVPLAVSFDGRGSSDPDPGDTLSYAWDLDGNGVYNDSTSPTPAYTYSAEGVYNVGLQVTDSYGLSSTDHVIITAGNSPPTTYIDSPSGSLTWRVGQSILFSGHATDPEQGTLPASALTWALIMHHCPSGSTCHIHTVQTFSGVASGSFNAPDHQYPSYLELQLTATDSGGLSNATSVLLYPETVTLRFASSPTEGLQLSVNGTASAAPFTRTVIVGSNNSLTAPSPQKYRGKRYVFSSWSDGGAQTHTIVSPAEIGIYTAAFLRTN